MIGAGQHILVEMRHEGALVHRGILPPGEDAFLRFKEGPQVVSSFSLVRITKEQADAIPVSE